MTWTQAGFIFLPFGLLVIATLWKSRPKPKVFDIYISMQRDGIDRKPIKVNKICDVNSIDIMKTLSDEGIKYRIPRMNVDGRMFRHIITKQWIDKLTSRTTITYDIRSRSTSVIDIPGLILDKCEYRQVTLTPKTGSRR